ncbi:MAG TPA: class I SAM-dependent methyltransferase [Candidatus Dormibacteraeota bacterium]|nr:class I SAM-dependent methyltransferase [Candidatus Dormibacteraeota bacterium]
MVRLDPPGTLLQNQTVMEIVAKTAPRTFCEVGVGAGTLSLGLCRRGLSGVGIEFSRTAIEAATERLQNYIGEGRYRIVEADFMSMAPPPETFDLAVSMMVMEHVDDDAAFAARLKDLVRPGGTVIVGVPARRDRWGIEDEAAGHLRRYERRSLLQTLTDAGLSDAVVRSVSVPAANLTFHASNFLLRRAGEGRKTALSQRERTETSGVRDIPFKTVFPAPFKAILNPIAMYPLFVLQRAFYATDLGLTLVASARRPLQTQP